MTALKCPPGTAGSASWQINEGRGYSVNVTWSSDTTGDIVLPPLNGSTAVVKVNGVETKYGVTSEGLAFTIKGGSYVINVGTP